MVISHDHKFIFFAVGKTGTHSVESALKKYADEFPMSAAEQDFFLEHMPPFFAREKLSSQIWRNYFKFAYVRNTWDMVISDLLWNKLVDGNIDRITVRNVCDLYENQKQYRRGITWRESREQYSFLADMQGNLLVDFVGRFERFQEDFDEICEKIGIHKEQLPVLNRQHRRPYREYYTPETIGKVKQLWATDIEKFNFVF